MEKNWQKEGNIIEESVRGKIWGWRGGGGGRLNEEKKEGKKGRKMGGLVETQSGPSLNHRVLSLGNLCLYH